MTNVLRSSGAWTDIPNASSAAYTPDADDDENQCLRATATYTDNISGDGPNDNETAQEGLQVAEVSERPVQGSDPANTAPKFSDQDLTALGDQSDETSRSVVENTPSGQNVGTAVTADDADLLLYSLSGTDADSFTVNEQGQIKTKAKLDFETKATYTVVVNATDPSGAQDSILVNINVTDGDDDAGIQLNVAPAFADDSADRSVAENSEAGTAIGDPVTATDTNTNDTLSYALSGDDAESFSIDSLRPDLRRCGHCPGLRIHGQLHRHRHRHRQGRRKRLHNSDH